MPYQVFEAAGFEQDLSRNEIKGTLLDHVFQFTYTLILLGEICAIDSRWSVTRSQLV